MEKPSLHEIAAMPFPASQAAMRKHYNPHWGKEIPEGAEKRKFTVSVDWTASGTEYYTVEAFTEDEAEDEAAEKFEADIGGVVPDGAEWDDCTVSEKRKAAA